MVKSSLSFLLTTLLALSPITYASHSNGFTDQPVRATLRQRRNVCHQIITDIYLPTTISLEDCIQQIQSTLPDAIIQEGEGTTLIAGHTSSSHLDGTHYKMLLERQQYQRQQQQQEALHRQPAHDHEALFNLAQDNCKTDQVEFLIKEAAGTTTCLQTVFNIDRYHTMRQKVHSFITPSPTEATKESEDGNESGNKVEQAENTSQQHDGRTGHKKKRFFFGVAAASTDNLDAEPTILITHVAQEYQLVDNHKRDSDQQENIIDQAVTHSTRRQVTTNSTNFSYPAPTGIFTRYHVLNAGLIMASIVVPFFALVVYCGINALSTIDSRMGVDINTATATMQSRFKDKSN